MPSKIDKQPLVTETPNGRPLRAALKTAFTQATSNIAGLGALIGVLTGLVSSYYVFEKKLDLLQPWPGLICAAVLVFFFLVYVLPEWLDQRKLEKLRIAGISGQLKDPSYFRLTPYEQQDTEAYKRRDNAGEAAIRWIGATTLPLLYLSGQSGAGKSSLINAAIAPALLSSDWIVVTLRPHDDLLGALARGLLAAKAIWAKPPGLTDPRAIVDAAAERVAKGRKRLLVVVDQFEEALILCAEPAKAQLAALLRDLAGRSVPGLVVLLSLRAEYLNDLTDMKLPPPAFGPGQNAFEVRPFTRAAAQAFIEESGLSLGVGLLDDVLKEAAEIEDMPDRVRPIVLNMFGLVVSSFKGVLPKGVEAGRLLSGYVERSLGRSASPGIAVRVLRPLVTDAGTKRTMTTALIAERAKVSLPVARGCLVQLANDGLVRALQTGEERWELAHDFVARLLQPILRTWRESLWALLRPWAIPASMAVWLVAIGAAAILYPRLHEDYLLAQLRSIGLVPGPPTGGRDVRFIYNGTPIINSEHFWRVAQALHNLPEPVFALDLNKARLTSLVGMPDLRGLTLLNLRLTKLKSLEGMPNLKALAVLDLSNSDLISLKGMPDLKLLEYLDLRNLSVDLSYFPDMPELRVIHLEGTIHAENFISHISPKIKDLPKMSRIYVDRSNYQKIRDYFDSNISVEIVDN